MRIIIPTENGKVAQHFGRCPEYTIYDIEDKKIIHKENVMSPGHEPGMIPQMFNEMGADWVITGGMGRRAQQLLDNYGICWMVGLDGATDDIINDFLADRLTPGESRCSHGEGHGDGHGHCHD